MLMKRSMRLFNMMNYIKKPNLPENKVSAVAISHSAGESIKKLNSLDILTIEIKSNPFLPLPVNSHADLQLLHMGNNTIFCQNEHLFSGGYKEKFITHIIDEKIGNKYPDDVRLNCAIIGNKIICNNKTISRTVLEFAYNNDYTIINVNQGYTRCSVCVLNENAIITDDESIFTAAGNFLNDALLISKGSIRLDGYNYGFIGGCCGKIDKDKIAFNGRIESHKDSNKIIDILQRNNIECIELCDSELIDIGGIIPLIEV